MELMSHCTSLSSQKESSTPTKPLGTPTLICSRSPEGSDLVENCLDLTNQLKVFSIMDAFSLSMGKLGDSEIDNFLLCHQKLTEMNKLTFISQIGNMASAVTDFVSVQLSTAALPVQVII